MEILNKQRPAISDDGRLLPEQTRSQLAHLRSGLYSLLNCYRERIVLGTLNRCPDYQQLKRIGDRIHPF